MRVFSCLLMKKDKFFIKVAFLTFLLVTLVVGSEQFFQIKWHHFTWYNLLFHLLVSISTYFIMLDGAKKGGLDFSNSIMISSGIRLLGSAVVLLSFFYFFKENQLSFILSFFTFYLFYTTFEIMTLLSNLRQISNSPSKSDENIK